MKVAGTRATNAGSIRRPKRSNGASGDGFASALATGDETAASSAAGATGALDMLDGVLSLQEVGDRGGERRRARVRGEQVLQRLEQIRLGLLAGRIPTHQLNELVRALRESRSEFTEPRLVEILDEIELRAAVELAKLDHFI
jgi:hypothetical protein